MKCEKHGAMLCYGNAYFDKKLKRIYRCVLGADKNGKEIRTCEILQENLK